MNAVTAIRGIYAEQWLHEHRDELPGEIVDHIEQLRFDRDDALQESEEVWEQLQHALYQLRELREPVKREAQG